MYYSGFGTSNIGVSYFLIPLNPSYSVVCFKNGLCTNEGNGLVWCSCHGDWTCLVYLLCMISLQYIMS